MLISEAQIEIEVAREKAKAFRKPVHAQVNGKAKRTPIPVRRIGLPGPTNPEFEELRRERGYSPARMQESPLVTDEIYAERMCACISCPHATRFADGAVFCECCVCRAWRHDMRILNRHADNLCRRKDPAFGQVHMEGA